MKSYKKVNIMTTKKENLQVIQLFWFYVLHLKAMKNRRLTKELKDFQKDPPSNIRVELKDDTDLFHWYAYITGPEDSPYSGYDFKVEVKFPTDYPFKAPKVNMLTKIYHPNIDGTGTICLDILRGKWSPALNIQKTLLSISSLLCDPNPDSAMNMDAAVLYKNNLNTYNKTAKEWAEKYAEKKNN